MRRLSLYLVVLFAFPRCNCDEAGSPPGKKGVGEACTTTSECEVMLTCEAGTCQSCDTLVCGDACCAEDQSCVSGACTDPVCNVSCGPQADCCAGGEVCTVDFQCCGPERVCGDTCCGTGEICEAGTTCRVDCGGGQLGCGASQVCCASGEVCSQGLCVIAGPPCAAQGCATRPDEASCPEGQSCDPSLSVCVPTAIDETCIYVPPVGTFEPTPLFTWGKRRARSCTIDTDCQTAEVCTSSTCAVTWTHVEPGVDDMPDHVQVTSIPMVTDLDGDCIPEIVFNSYDASNFTQNGVLRAIRGDSGTKVWTVTATAYRTDSTANPAIGDVDNDGSPEVFVAGVGKVLRAFRSDGTPWWTSETFTGPQNSGSAALANLDGAGHAEIIFGATVFDSAGKILFAGGLGQGIAGQGPISCVADLDGDGRPELIAGSTVYAFTGTVDGNDFVGAERFSITAPDGYCGIADFDNNGTPEIALVSAGTIYIADGQNGTILASLAIPGGGQGGAPNIADFDGDGVPDIGTAGAQNYVVMQFVDGQSNLEILWQAPTEDDSSNRTGSSVFDFDEDGRAEVVYGDEEFLRIYPGVEPDCALMPPGPGCDGIMNDDEILFRDLNSSRTRTEYPVVADVNGDFKAEIVFSTNNEASFLDPNFLGDSGIEVWRDRLDNWVATRPVWNQHSYHVTNVTLEGGVPMSEAPNWSTPAGEPINSYRRNTQGERSASFCAPDLQVSDLRQDTSACPDIALEASVRNFGCLGVGAGLEVSFFDSSGNLLGMVRTQNAISPGSGEVVRLEIPGQAAGVRFEARAVVDDGGRVNECIDTNNDSEVIVVECRINP